MLIEDVRKLSTMDRLIYWIKEREDIRIRRQSQLDPSWTDDEILQSYRFCNVVRKEDRVSQWLIENWYEPYFDHPNSLLACTLARQFNLPGTLKVVGYPDTWNPKKLNEQLTALYQAGVTLYNSAYLITGCLDRTKYKFQQTIWKVCNPIHDIQSKLIDKTSMRVTWKKLTRQTGFGSFIAGQVVADLYLASELQWSDRKIWAPVGPGSSRGMNRLMEKTNINKVIGQGPFEDKLLQLINKLRSVLPKKLTKRMTGIDYQNCLCEFDKYERTLWGQGRPKRNYDGRGDNRLWSGE